MPNVNVLTFNSRGLRHASKRRALFRHFHHYYPTHIVVLQETHSAPRDVAYWQAEWGAPVMFSHGPSTSECGVAVLLPRSLLGICNVVVKHSDDAGRLLNVDFSFEQLTVLICAVYAPTQGHMQQQLVLFNTMKAKLNTFTANDDAYLIVCGDFNLHLSKLDT